MIKLHVRKISTGSTAPTARAKIVGDTNADVRSVCGSKHSCLFCITLTEHDAYICVTFFSSSLYAVVMSTQLSIEKKCEYL